MNASSDASASFQGAALPEPARGRILTLLAAGHGVTHWFQGILTVALPLITRDFGITYTQLGALRSVQRVSHIISITVGGLATDFLKDRKGILLLSLVWPSLFFSLQGFSTTFLIFGALLCTQALLGGFLWHAPARAVIGDRFPDRMGFALGIHAMGGNLAAAAGPAIVGAVLAWVTWRTVFAFQFLPGIATALFLWLLLPRLGHAPREGQSGSYGRALRSDVLTNLPLIGVTVVAGLRSIGENLIPTFLPLYLSVEMKMGTAAIGVYLGCLALVGTVFAPIVGHMSDRWGRKSTIFVSLLTGGLLIGSIPLFPSGWLLLPVVSLGGMALFAVGPIIQASGLEHAPKEIWGAAQTFMDVGRSSLSLVFPLIVGAVADHYGLSYTFYLFGAVNLLAAVTVLAIPRARTPTKT